MTQKFDISAGTYDSDFTQSLTGKLQRNMVWKHLDQLLARKKNLRILELNCGTGEDALYLARAGHIVTATDISSDMCDQAQTKIRNSGLSYKVQVKKADITTLETLDVRREFDLIFSNFGGFNCLTSLELQAFKSKAQKFLKPGGSMVLVVMPEMCLWESFYFLGKFRLNQAFRRKRNFSMANVKGQLIKTWYYSPKTLKRLFAPEFSSVRVKPIGFFAPPSYLEQAMNRVPNFFRLLSFLERQFSTFSWQGAFADHYYIELKEEEK